jgi:hypothetical protein
MIELGHARAAPEGLAVLAFEPDLVRRFASSIELETGSSGLSAPVPGWSGG